MSMQVEDRYPALTNRFIGRLQRYFGVKGIKFAKTESVHDIACVPARNLILLGKLWQKDRPEVQQAKVVHEFIHLYGYPHNTKMRQHGYFSKPERDSLSSRVYADILSGTDKFEPAKLGLPSLARKGDNNMGKANPISRRDAMLRAQKAWQTRYLTGGKGTCAFCHQPIYAGGVRAGNKKYHKTCYEAKRYRLQPWQVGRNPGPRASRNSYRLGATPINPGALVFDLDDDQDYEIFTTQDNPIGGRPPGQWWAKMYPRVAAGYPHASPAQLATITAGVWHGYSPATQGKLLRKYEGRRNPWPFNPIRRLNPVSGFGDVTAAAKEYIARQERTSHPVGHFDRAGRWYPSDEEWQRCCTQIRGPSRAWPYPLLKHARSATHVAQLYGVDVKDLRQAVRRRNPWPTAVPKLDNRLMPQTSGGLYLDRDASLGTDQTASHVQGIARNPTKYVYVAYVITKSGTRLIGNFWPTQKLARAELARMLGDSFYKQKGITKHGIMRKTSYTFRNPQIVVGYHEEATALPPAKEDWESPHAGYNFAIGGGYHDYPFYIGGEGTLPVPTSDQVPTTPVWFQSTPADIPVRYGDDQTALRIQGVGRNPIRKSARGYIVTSPNRKLRGQVLTKAEAVALDKHWKQEAKVGQLINPLFRVSGKGKAQILNPLLKAGLGGEVQVGNIAKAKCPSCQNPVGIPPRMRVGRCPHCKAKVMVTNNPTDREWETARRELLRRGIRID